MQDKIASLTAEKATLTAEISQRNQNATILSAVGQQIAPLAAGLQALQGDVDKIKCKMCIRDSSKEAKQLLIQFETEKSKLDIILKQLTAEKKISKETAEQIRNGQNLGDTLKNKIGESGRIFSEFSSALPHIASDLENVFGSMSDGTKDVINSKAEAAGGIAQIATGIAQGPVGYLQAAMGLAKTVRDLFGSDDARLQKEIEGQERKIKKLEREYDKLKESKDNVWDLSLIHI